MNTNYFSKYIKYKHKYLSLKAKQKGGRSSNYNLFGDHMQMRHKHGPLFEMIPFDTFYYLG